MERRVLIAITLSFLVLFLFQRFVMPPPDATPVNQSGATAGQASGTATPAPGSMAALTQSANQTRNGTRGRRAADGRWRHAG